jgi:adenylylsulfate kinase-like enzyme
VPPRSGTTDAAFTGGPAGATIEGHGIPDSPHPPGVRRRVRAQGPPVSVVWINGPLGAGKTTLAHALRALVHPVAAVALLDEDDVREAVADATMAWTVESAIPIAQLSGLARVLSQQCLVVVVAASDAEPSVLAWNREHLPGYREVFLRASPETIKHHARRRQGENGRATSAAGIVPAPGSAAAAAGATAGAVAPRPANPTAVPSALLARAASL